MAASRTPSTTPRTTKPKGTGQITKRLLDALNTHPPDTLEQHYPVGRPLPPNPPGHWTEREAAERKD